MPGGPDILQKLHLAGSIHQIARPIHRQSATDPIHRQFAIDPAKPTASRPTPAIVNFPLPAPALSAPVTYLLRARLTIFAP